MSGVDLARRAVACPGWRWMPGMRAVSIFDDDDDGFEHAGVVVFAAHGWLDIVGETHEHDIDVSFRDERHESSWLPDLDDPATLGCLLALVCEAWDGCIINVETSHRERPGEPHISQSLVAMLEAAPRREAAL